ncbi:MAG: pantetheine-phosphate adenylyltransferase [Nitrosopumilaceae archaeon]|nr:pantetheine-phosphate adenylyltransferase [Nitrosopumilaceae archaeon]
MFKFITVAVGGTFDVIHKGHMTLFDKAFSISKHVIIGLTSDKFIKQKNKHVLHNYNMRYIMLKHVLYANFPDKFYTIYKIDDNFGPTLYYKDLDALVVSNDTQNIGYEINHTRRKNGLHDLEIIIMPIIMAVDNKPISSTRIRNSEIDNNGNLNVINK